MEQNVGKVDRLVRIVLGAGTGAASLAILSGMVAAPPVLSLALGVVALIALSTAATSTCGLYSVLGVSTCPRDRSA